MLALLLGFPLLIGDIDGIAIAAIADAVIRVVHLHVTNIRIATLAKTRLHILLLQVGSCFVLGLLMVDMPRGELSCCCWAEFSWKTDPLSREVPVCEVSGSEGS